MRLIRDFSFVGVFALGFCRLSAAATLVVGPGEVGEFPTIQLAVDAAADSDTVLLSSGIYTGPGNMAIDLRGKALTIRSKNGPRSTIIDCRDAAENGFVLPAGNSDVVISGLTIQRATGAAVDCDYGTWNVRIENCILARNGYGVRNLAFSSIAVSNCQILDNAFDGIRCHLRSDPTIEDCTISSNGGAGIFIEDECSGTIGNCTIQENGGCGLFCLQSYLEVFNCDISRNGGDGLIIEQGYLNAVNCTVASNLRYGIDISSMSILGLKNCIVWGQDDGSIAIDYLYGYPVISVAFSCIQGDPLWPGEGNINLDPLLRHDLRPFRGSPAIDSGTMDGAPMIDLDGMPRPMGKGIEMGAYEYRSVGPSSEELEVE